MTQPVSYVPAVGFQAEETAAVAGRSTIRTSAIDAELQAVSLTLSQILTNLAVIQRDDTGLRDLVVTTESLSANVKALFAGGVNPRGAWLTATSYAVKDVVETLVPLISYICVIAHTSGTFATDRTAGKWMVLGSEPGVGTLASLTLTTGGITLGTNNTQDLAATANRFRSGYFGTSVFASTSVVTPLVGTGSDVKLDLGINGTAKWSVRPSTGNFDFYPTDTDNTASIGLPTNRIKQAFTPIIDSGTTGSLSLRTNNGTEQARVDHVANAVNVISLNGGATLGSAVIGVGGASADANAGLNLYCRGTGTISFLADTNSTVQFQIVRTASANRNITVTGSNGGNPTISTTAGSLLLSSAASPTNGVTVTGGAGNQTLGVTTGNLAITPSVVIAGATLSVGANPATVGILQLPYGAATSCVNSRNNANSANMTLITSDTRNAVVDLVMVGLTSTNGVQLKVRSGAGAPTTSDLAPSEWTVWRDTTGATTKVYYNNAGAIIASAAFA